MTQSKHTPAPWIIKRGLYGGINIGKVGYNGGYNHKIASVPSWTNENYGQSEGEAIANSLLIAAAPELLEALESVLMAHDYDGVITMGDAILSPAIRGMVERTIKKAKGEQDV